MKSKKIFIDVVLNLISAALPLFALQYMSMPNAAKQMTAVTNGEMLSAYSLAILIGSAFGSVLNNTRLIRHRDYLNKGIIGDYNILLVSVSVISAVVTFTGIMIVTPGVSFLDNLFMSISTVIFLVITYLNAAFRLKLDYKGIFIDNVIRSIGHIVGLLLYRITGLWSLMFISGYLFSLIYQLIKTDFLKEPFIKTDLFTETAKQYSILLASGFLVSLGTYIDRLLLFPLLGGESVSVYYAATLLGKTISMIIGPMTSVMLSYFAQMDHLSGKNFRTLLLSVGGVGAIGYIAIMLVSEFALGLVYPQYVSEALKYIPVTTITVIVGSICNLVNAVLLKFRASTWQFAINGIYLALYLVFALVMLGQYGLMGFCIGILIATIIKFLIMMLVYIKTSPTQHEGALKEA